MFIVQKPSKRVKRPNKTSKKCVSTAFSLRFLAIQGGKSAKCLQIHFLVGEIDAKMLFEKLRSQVATSTACGAALMAAQDGFQRLLVRAMV